MENIQAQNLMTDVYDLIKKDREESFRTGDGFNIFEILELSSNETRTHSAFLAAMLQPKGLHGMEAVFLSSLPILKDPKLKPFFTIKISPLYFVDIRIPPTLFTNLVLMGMYLYL